MGGFVNIQDIINAEEAGQFSYATWRKSPVQVNTAGIWFDLSMSPGNPKPQYYADAPLKSVALKKSTDGGLFHGPDVSPKYKYLKSVMALATVATGLPMPMILLDYLLYYPFIDEGITDPQDMTNNIPLPRYTDGLGVQIMAVSVAARTGGQTFFVNYTNELGVSGRTTKLVIENTATANGSIVTTNTTRNFPVGPFIHLQTGDKGVRSIDSVTMITPDVGLFTLVLVKPLMTFQIRGIDAPVEKELFKDSGSLPRIYDDAYLNFICLPVGALNATAIHGDISFFWN